MPKSQKKYIFIKTSPYENNKEVSMESLGVILQNYKKLANIKLSGSSVPFTDIIEIPEDFYEFILNKLVLHKGITFIANNMISYNDLNATIICVEREDLREFFQAYYENLKTVLDKLVKNVKEVSDLIITMDTFKNKFIEVIQEKNNVTT